MKKTMRCPTCDGKRTIHLASGQKPRKAAWGDGWPGKQVTCPACRGTGKVQVP